MIEDIETLAAAGLNVALGTSSRGGYYCELDFDRAQVAHFEAPTLAEATAQARAWLAKESA